MVNFFDLNRIPGNGQIVLMLSMSRLFLGQNAKKTYETILHLLSKVAELSIDVYCIYTNGLYFNSDQVSIDVRRRTTNQMLQHHRELKALILRDKKMQLQTVNFLVWDSLILNCLYFSEMQVELFKLYEEDSQFQSLVQMEVKNSLSEVNINFVLEETIVTYLLREGRIQLPTIFSGFDAWRLLVYAGGALLPDVYLSRAKPEVLSTNSSWFHKLCRKGMYNSELKNFVDYNRIPLMIESEEFFDAQTY